MTTEQIKNGTKAAKQDMKLAKKEGAIGICETKMGFVEMVYENGLYQLLKNGAVVFQAYEHTVEIFISNMVTRVYEYE